MFEILDTVNQTPSIKVIGVGGGGCNAVDYMLKEKIEGVEFIAANTDAQALRKSSCDSVMQLGSALTRGLGAGADPAKGKQAAEEDRERIKEFLSDSDMVFITAGMGGGTGTGAAPVIAEVAKEVGALTVAVVTRPFHFEGQLRARQAEAGLQNLKGPVDSLIVIENEKLLQNEGAQDTMKAAFAKANDVLRNAVQGVSELITLPGFINVDFADVKNVMEEMGMAVMGSATASGEQRAHQAAKDALGSPLLKDIKISGAKGVLVNITASEDSFGINECEAVGNVIADIALQDAKMVIGTSFDDSLGDSLRVTMVVTGLPEDDSSAGRFKLISTGSSNQGDSSGDLVCDNPSTLTQRSHNDSSALPIVVPDEESQLDLPTYLRTLAD